jgi:aldehyde dehydrogenase
MSTAIIEEGATCLTGCEQAHLGGGVWSRNGTDAYRLGRGIKTGRVWTNCYHLYPADAAFGGYKESGFGCEKHKMILDHYRQRKNVLVSYSLRALGFF